jgi:hypothetical protein
LDRTITFNFAARFRQSGAAPAQTPPAAGHRKSDAGR